VVRDYQQKERYILVDYFIIDLKEKKLMPYKEKVRESEHADWFYEHDLGLDPFFKTIGKIKDIKVVNNKSKGTKTIYVYTRHKEPIEIEINKSNQMIRYKNNHVRKLPKRTLCHNLYLKELQLDNVVLIYNNCLRMNRTLEKLSLKSIYEIGEDFLLYNKILRNAILPKYFFIHDGFMGWNQVFDRQPIGIKNRFVKYMRTPDWGNGPIVFFHMLLAALINQSFKLTNKIMNKKEFDFTSDEITIKTIKKTNSLSHLIDFIIAKKPNQKELEEEIKKGESL
jgi:hypothetical protein